MMPIASKAKILTYTHTVRQPFSGSQAPDDARVAAIAKIKREVLEKAGTYIESMTLIKNNVVDEDEILALAAGLLKAEITSEKKFLEGNEFGIYITAKVVVDTSILENQISKLSQDPALLEQYQISRQREDQILDRIAKLEENIQKMSTLKSSTNVQKERKSNKRHQDETLGLTAVDLRQRAFALMKDGYYEQAIENYSKAIFFNPLDASSYAGRGYAYMLLENYQKAILDFNSSLRLDSNNAGIYTRRGNIHWKLGNHKDAINDFETAIQLDPEFALAYAYRGNAYQSFSLTERACSDWKRSCELGADLGCRILTNANKSGLCW